MGAVSGVYTVKRKFKAGGVEYLPGQEYDFGSGQREEKLLKCGYVEFEPLHDDKSRAQRGRKAKVKDASK